MLSTTLKVINISTSTLDIKISHMIIQFESVQQKFSLVHTIQIILFNCHANDFDFTERKSYYN